ncbi:MAG: hypothetical protein HY754_14015 [Nitrospirae bacterium]|nr:hypothetical protein [Nitrospirota bacterium]
MRDYYLQKRYSESTGKLHIPCPYREKTGINVHVVLRGGYCYRSGQCMIIKCRYNRVQSDPKALLSLVW